MKTIATLSLLTAAALSLAPKPAQAGDEGLAIIGGLIGGVLIANAIDNHLDTHTRVVVSNRNHYRDVHWVEAPVRIWVEPRWTIIYDDCHRPIRHYLAGHFITRPRRTWVCTPSYHRNYHRLSHPRHYRRND